MSDATAHVQSCCAPSWYLHEQSTTMLLLLAQAFVLYQYYTTPQFERPRKKVGAKKAKSMKLRMGLQPAGEQ